MDEALSMYVCMYSTSAVPPERKYFFFWLVWIQAWVLGGLAVLLLLYSTVQQDQEVEMGMVILTGRGIGQSGVWDVYCTVLCCKIYGWMGWGGVCKGGCVYCRLMTTMIMRMMMLMIMLIMVLMMLIADIDNGLI